MKHIFTYILLSILFTSSASAQTVELIDPVDTVFGDQLYEMIGAFYVKNADTADAEIVCTRTTLHQPETADNAFCFGHGCYDSSIDVSDPFMLKADETTKEVNKFKGQYYADYNVDTARVRYTFENQNNNDTASHVTTYAVIYDSTISISENSRIDDVIDPIGSQSFLVSGESLLLYNLNGALLHKEILSGPSQVFTIPSYYKGILILAVRKGNNAYAKKVFVD